MIALLQRVTTASVTVDEHRIAEIGQGLLVLVGVERADNADTIDKISDKLLKYRVFSDDSGKMNLNVMDIHGQVLLVPQFTLAADTRKGLRPGFSSAASPEHGQAMFDQLVDIMRQKGTGLADCHDNDWLQTGQFGADMAVALINDGPVTFHLSA